MKLWRCPGCNTERISEDNIVVKACYVCQISMEVVDGETRKSE